MVFRRAGDNERDEVVEEQEDSLAFVRSQMATYPENGRRVAFLACPDGAQMELIEKK